MSGEDFHLDVTDAEQCREVVKRAMFDAVVCTAGINRPTRMSGGTELQVGIEDMMAVNFAGHMNVLQAWLGFWFEVQKVAGGPDETIPKHFVSISSNSAQIARTGSLGYCASKAALSMGIRCAAREVAKEPVGPAPMAIYAYEPGWLEGTPMSDSVENRLGIGVMPHRIPGGRGIHVGELSEMIALNIRQGSANLNGCVLRVDGGEQ